MNRLKIVWIAAISSCIASVSVAAYAALSAPKDAHVGFQASGPAGLKIEGTTSDLNVAETEGNIVIDVPLANLSTGIALRDHHMKEKYLEVPKYPSATLVVARAALKLPAAGASSEADAPATLKLHGQGRPVTVHYVAKGDGSGFAIDGKFRVKMDEFGITVPSYLGVTVKPDVNVNATFHVAGN
jgi:polyisoprenoid-binding protein YceI